MPERKGKTENILENNGQNFFSSDENCTPRDPGISMSLKYNMKKSTSRHVTIKLLKITDKTNIKSMWRYRTHYKLFGLWECFGCVSWFYFSKHVCFWFILISDTHICVCVCICLLTVRCLKVVNLCISTIDIWCWPHSLLIFHPPLSPLFTLLYWF